MAHLIKGDNISQVWRNLIGDIFTKGRSVAPRGIPTREVLNVTLEIDHGLNNIIESKPRGLNYRFMIAEWLWIMGGLNDVESLSKYNSVMRQFSDDGEILNGAYGPRLSHQWDYIIGSLNSSNDSRQAVSIIWTPTPGPSKDVPCTISLQWFIRNFKLHCTVNMRSSDLWLGLPYDYFTFSQLTNALSSKIGLSVGSVTMNLGSSHLYDANEEGAMKVLSERSYSYLSSPQLKPFSKIPTHDEIKFILNNASFPAYLDIEPWRSYEKALLIDKQDALNELRKLSHIGMMGR